jgi:hypothetical protein
MSWLEYYSAKADSVLSTKHANVHEVFGQVNISIKFTQPMGVMFFQHPRKAGQSWRDD